MARNILCFKESWLSWDMLPESVQPPGFSMYRTNRYKHLSAKRKGGGVCFMNNESWCKHNSIQELKSFCSPNLEFLTIKCCPYYLPRELSSVIVTAVYIPPQADTTTVLKELHWTLCKLETIYPEAAFIVAGDLNKAWEQGYLNSNQHINCSTRRGNTLDHCYSNFHDAVPRTPFGKSDHDAILLLPSYRQKLKQDVPVTRIIQCWYDQSESTLQDCFDQEMD